jgi:peptidyl-prolyl cis-trans isomerase SurA
MKKRLHLVLAFCMAGTLLAQAGDVIDRIVATVNGHIILQSDWEEALAYRALAEKHPPLHFSLEERKAALDRLIDQELIREQVRVADFRPAAPAEIDARIADIRKQYPEAADEDGWNTLLRQYGLTAQELTNRVKMEFDEMRAVDARLSPSVQIDSHSVEVYYREKLLPELQHAGVQPVPLTDVAPRIREILAQQKINDLLVTWLQNLRSESTIRTTPVPSVSGAGGGGY